MWWRDGLEHKCATLDRLIAAQAIARDATLITRNGKDFRRIEGLRLVEWEPLEPVATAK